MIITTTKGKAKYSWQITQHGDASMMDADQGDCESIGWVVKAKGDKFLVFGYYAGGREVRLPRQDFSTRDIAIEWCMEYDAQRQQKWMKREEVSL